MIDKLPSWDSTFSVKRNYRCWKRLIRQAGRRRSFELLEPEVRRLTTKLRKRQHTACDKSKSMRPTERRRLLLLAFDEIREEKELVYANKIVDDWESFTSDVSGIGLCLLIAGLRLIESMMVRSHFEFKVMGCLTMLDSIDEDVVQDYGDAIVEHAANQERRGGSHQI